MIKNTPQPAAGSLAHGRGALIGARGAPTHTHTRTPAGPGVGDPGDTDTGGWFGVISAGRARWSKRGERGEEESERGRLKKKKKVLRRGNGPQRRADCLSVSPPRCPSCPAPAAVRNSHKMAARPGRARRLRRDETRGGRGNWEAEAMSRGGERQRQLFR